MTPRCRTMWCYDAPLWHVVTANDISPETVSRLPKIASLGGYLGGLSCSYSSTAPFRYGGRKCSSSLGLMSFLSFSVKSHTGSQVFSTGKYFVFGRTREPKNAKVSHYLRHVKLSWFSVYQSHLPAHLPKKQFVINRFSISETWRVSFGAAYDLSCVPLLHIRELHRNKHRTRPMAT